MTLYVVETQEYESDMFHETQVKQGDTYVMEQPNKMFVTLVADGDRAGDFQLTY